MGYNKLGSILLSLLLLGSSAAAEQITEDVTEYEYDLSEIECDQGQTAQVERFFYPQENRAECRVNILLP